MQQRLQARLSPPPLSLSPILGLVLGADDEGGVTRISFSDDADDRVIFNVLLFLILAPRKKKEGERGVHCRAVWFVRLIMR